MRIRKLAVSILVLSFLFIVHSSAIILETEKIITEYRLGFNDAHAEKSATETGYPIRATYYNTGDWSGVFIHPIETEKWDFSEYEYLAMEIKNVGDNSVKVGCLIANPGMGTWLPAKYHCNYETIFLKPNERGTLKINFRRKPYDAQHLKKLFYMKGFPAFDQDMLTIDPSNIIYFIIIVETHKNNYNIISKLKINNIRVGGKYSSDEKKQQCPIERFFPFIDTFGQYLHRNWHGKTHSIKELSEKIKLEAKDLKTNPGPSNWDIYGGWKNGPKLESKGFFWTTKYNRKWWLVDPEGNIFFSHGVNCVGYGDITPITYRETWFQDFPGYKQTFKELLTEEEGAITGCYTGKKIICFNFYSANLKRKYGDYWKEEHGNNCHQRLHSWGLNTIGNWSEPDIYLMRKTPYVVGIHFESKELEGSEGYWGKFKDVFDTSFKENLRKRMQEEVGKSANDPWCIGYFIDNELNWGDNELFFAISTLRSPATQAAKRTFVNDLKYKYGFIKNLNYSWDTKYCSWEELLISTTIPPMNNYIKVDFVNFNKKFIRRYFELCRDTIKEFAPNNLYLGCRFGSGKIDPTVVRIAAEYCDILSYNCYWKDVSKMKLPKYVDIPIIISEFHFGALDRGPFHAGLVYVENQVERGKSYMDFVKSALKHPNIVGCHWFQFMDQPTTGRLLDGENYQIGLVDIVDIPYTETIKGCREIGYQLYPELEPKRNIVSIEK